MHRRLMSCDSVPLCCGMYTMGDFYCRVEPALFYLVFGESVLNDAVALTVFNIAEKFIGTSHGAAVSVHACIQF